jgi:uncharacterized protein (TIGR00369 family)
VSLELEPRRVQESSATMSELMMPQHANNLGNVFGGVILSLVDRVAAVAATRHARRSCVTVSVDRVDFLEPIYLGELVTARAAVVYAGRTSMEVSVEVEAENLVTGRRRRTNRCAVTYVAIDEHGKPAPVPPVLPETEEEWRRYREAEARRAKRLAERDRGEV